MFTSRPPSMHQRRAQGDGGDGEEKRDEQSTMVACPAVVRRPSRRTSRWLLEGLAAVPGGHVTDSSALVWVVVAEFPHTWRTNGPFVFLQSWREIVQTQRGPDQIGAAKIKCETSALPTSGGQ